MIVSQLEQLFMHISQTESKMAVKYDHWTDWFNVKYSEDVINKENQEGISNAFSGDFSYGASKDAVSNHGETVFIQKLVIFNCLNILHHFIGTGDKIYDQMKNPLLIQGMSAMLSSAVTLDTEELFFIPIEEAVGVPNIANIMNVISAKDIDGLMNVTTNNYNPSNFITIPYILVISVVNTIASPRGDTKDILVKVVK